MTLFGMKRETHENVTFVHITNLTGRLLWISLVFFLMWNIYFKFRLLLSLCFGVGGHKSHKPKQVTCVLLTCWHDFVSFYAFPTPSSFFVLKEIETMRAGTYSVFLKSFHSFLLISIYGVKVSIIRVALYFYWNRDCFCHTPLFQKD